MSQRARSFLRRRHRDKAKLRIVVLGVFLLGLVLLAGGSEAHMEEPDGKRDELTSEALMGGDGLPTRPIHNAWFMPVGQSGPAHHTFSGTLVIPEMRMTGFDGRDLDDSWFPQVEVRFVSHDGFLVPIDSGILRGTGRHSNWSVIVSPGRIWSEPGDGGLSRASFPFVLAGGAWWNEAHNGLATFVFDADSVSDIQIQIVQETAPENEFSAAAHLDADYVPTDFAESDEAIREFYAERQSRLPVRSFTDLDGELSLDALRTFAGPSPIEPVSASGLIFDGVLYLRPCETRFGDFPYCEDMRHGVYSVTKSLGALIAMLRLAELYGVGVFDLKIKDYLDVSASHDGWRDVTFGDALNMATGIGDASPDRDGDGYRAEIYPSRATTMFSNSPSKAWRLRAAFAGGNYAWGPGEEFRYRNMDTFILSAAMDSFLKRQEGSDADVWDMVTEDVFRPIGIMQLPVARTEEQSDRRGIPVLAAGAYPTVHDIAKIAVLLQNGGRQGNEQLLNEAKLAEALYQTETRGLAIARRDGQTYHMSFWYFRSRQRGCVIDVPRMDGWGGNIVELLPNGMTAIYLSDDFTYAIRDFADAAHELKSLCSH